jgi:Ca2+/H+ antiporter, TMEM165/GDT1 family
LNELTNSFLLVFLGEMGDKTQILALILAARFKKPWTILAGVFIATLLNHGLATWFGSALASFVSPENLRWILGISFLGFALWILIPDKDPVGAGQNSRYGPFITTLITFFLAEMGDKTQLATIALGAQYSNLAFVTLGSTLGMMVANALAIFLGERLLKRIPLTWIRVFASILFALFGLGILLPLMALFP